MKRKTKLALGGITLLLGAVALSGCTASFCTVTDKAHILYAFDYGVTDYVDASSADASAEQAYAYIDGVKVEFTNVKYKIFTVCGKSPRCGKILSQRSSTISSGQSFDDVYALRCKFINY